MARTTIARELLELIQLGKADKERILRDLEMAAQDAERLHHGPPAVTIEFHRLRRGEPASSAVVPSGGGLAHGTGAINAGMAVEAPVYDRVVSVPMYNLSDASRVDVLRFGRLPSQDVQLLDRLVSREHGLIILAGRVPLFCDYGTLANGKHAGSTNGTFLDGHVRIKDAILTWLPGQELHVGDGPMYTASHQPYFANKITYTLHT